MAGRIVRVPVVAHHCEGQGSAEQHHPGTVWQCDDCGKCWVVVSGQGEDGKGYSAWRELNGRNHTGEDLF